MKRWISSTNSSVWRPLVTAQPRRLEHLLEIGDAGKDRRDLLEGETRSRRPAAAPPSSCRCRAAPRRSSSRASPSGSSASARRPRRSDAPGRPPRPASSAAAGRPAAGPAAACSGRPRSKRSAISSVEHLPDQLAVALDGEAPPARSAARRPPSASRRVSISSPLTSRTMSRGWKPKPAAGELRPMSTTATPLVSLPQAKPLGEPRRQLRDLGAGKRAAAADRHFGGRSRLPGARTSVDRRPSSRSPWLSTSKLAVAADRSASPAGSRAHRHARSARRSCASTTSPGFSPPWPPARRR